MIILNLKDAHNLIWEFSFKEVEQENIQIVIIFGKIVLPLKELAINIYTING